MGGGKRSKHKNLYLNKQNSPTQVEKRETPKVTEKPVKSTEKFAVEDLKKTVGSGNAGASAGSEVMFPKDPSEEQMETSVSWDEADAKDGDSAQVPKVQENLSGTHNDLEGENFPSLSEKRKGSKKKNWGKGGQSLVVSELTTQRKETRSDNSSSVWEHNRNSSSGWSETANKRPDNRQNTKKEEQTEMSSSWDEADDREGYSAEVTEEVKGMRSDHLSSDSEHNQNRSSRWSETSNTRPDHWRNTKRDYDSKYSPNTKPNDRYGDKPQRSGSAGSKPHYGRSGSTGSRDGGHSRSNSKPRNLDYQYWKNNVCGIEEKERNVKESFGDLFCANNEYALGHCVAEDMNMGSGIAVQFRSYFKRVDELLQQRVTQGGVAVLHVDNRYIYYLVTKRRSSGKPTYETMFRSLCNMRAHVIENGVKKIALPRIGCGLDGLEWRDVKSMLQYVFKDVNVEIMVYNYQQDSSAPPPKPSKKKCRVVNVLKPVIDIDEYTTILYLCSVKRNISKEMEELDRKFNIKTSYETAKRDLGSVIKTIFKNTYFIYGIVVKETPEDSLNYQAFQRGIQEINKQNKKDLSGYIAMQGFAERNDNLTISKLVNLMRYTFFEVEIYICWPKELEYLAPRDIDYS